MGAQTGWMDTCAHSELLLLKNKIMPGFFYPLLSNLKLFLEFGLMKCESCSRLSTFIHDYFSSSVCFFQAISFSVLLTTGVRTQMKDSEHKCGFKKVLSLYLPKKQVWSSGVHKTGKHTLPYY